MKTGQVFKIFAVLLCAILILQPAASASLFAKDVRIVNMAAIKNPDDLMLSFKVEGAFRENLEQAVLSGALTTFSFCIIISESRGVLANKKVLQINLTNTIKYNNLKNDFTVNRSWEDNKPQVTESFEQAKQWMSEITNLKLMPLSHLQKDVDYQIKVKAELDNVTLPLVFNYIFFFFSLWDFETNWQTIRFVY